ncbi:MAG: hypothetical protein F4X44_07870 [Gammaproteobacteria bacterium]|nr:hypothetical protein [Gammaproteobacteria bacterium]MYD80514.1 hypothetical protein [Gammaproteobacteria bacterium]
MTYNPTGANRLLLRGSLYQYEVDGTITAHDAQTVLDSCHVEDIDAFCGFIEHRDNSTISLFTDTLFNIGTIETTGTDIGLSFDRNSPSLGQFTWTFDVTHVRSFEEILRML